MAKYAPGDKVILLDCRDQGMSKIGFDYDGGYYWITEMDKHIGKIFTIGKRKSKTAYGLKELKHTWGFEDRWLSPIPLLDEELFEI